jgi:hypothetical protein
VQNIAGAALAAAALLAGLAACSSPPSLAAQEQASRAPALPAAKQLRAQLASDGVSWTADLHGDYNLCGANDPLATDHGHNAVQYTAQMLMTSYDHTVSFATFNRQVVAAVGAAGWKLSAGTGASSQARSYTAQRGGVDLRMVQTDTNPGGLGPESTVFLSGGCFDAGSSDAAIKLMTTGPSDDVREPRPTTTPVPKYP